MSRQGTQPPVVVAVLLVFGEIENACKVIAAIKAQTFPVAHIIVVDNASPDNAADRIAAAHPDVELIRLAENRGVGAGHNLGWRTALTRPACDYIWSIEHDCFPEPACLAELLAARAALLGDDPLGVVMPLQLTSFSHDPRPHLVMRGGHVWWTSMQNKETQPALTHLFSFNGVLLPVGLFAHAGWLDENLFFFTEDLDYRRRCDALGIRFYLIPAARVFHDGLEDSRIADLRRFVVLLPRRANLLRTYYGTRNGIVVIARHSPNPTKVYVRNVTRGLLLLVWDLFFPNRWQRMTARALALRDALTGRLGRGDYAVLREK